MCFRLFFRLFFGKKNVEEKDLTKLAKELHESAEKLYEYYKHRDIEKKLAGIFEENMKKGRNDLKHAPEEVMQLLNSMKKAVEESMGKINNEIDELKKEWLFKKDIQGPTQYNAGEMLKEAFSKDSADEKNRGVLTTIYYSINGLKKNIPYTMPQDQIESIPIQTEALANLCKRYVEDVENLEKVKVFTNINTFGSVMVEREISHVQKFLKDKKKAKKDLME